MSSPATHTGRVAVVTGAAGGFGTAISTELARRGADVIAVDVGDASKTVEAVEALGRKAIALQADLSDPAAVEAITPEMLGFAGRVDILVNNAGIFPFEDLWTLTFERWREIFAINTDSQFLMTKAVIGSMKENNWGRILNVASNSLGLAVPDMVPYMASKGAVIGLTRALATDLAAYNITVNAILPTASRTPGGEKFIGNETLEMVGQMQAIKRVGTAQDVVGVMCFLTSEDCHFVTGQTISTDGGLVRL